ncbi:MAG: hypothetical protein FJY97_02155 [candidate division Zixibacteria bacterium]|nr:hypothetical protein [candidate division Zixibacteria bacterium]
MENAQQTNGTSGFTGEDSFIIDHAERFLQDGAALKRWWEEADANDGFTETFDLVHTFRRPERSRGFFGYAPLPSGRSMPVMGVVDEVFYDRPKTSADYRAAGAQWMRDQIREFVLRYFMRISDFRLPEETPDSMANHEPAYLRPMSMRTREEIQRKGMGFIQAFYKRRDTGEIGKFSPEETARIIDLREIGTVYDWLIVKLLVHDFTVTMKPFGLDAVRMVMPLKEQGYLILTPEFIVNEDDPEPGVLGRYGFGYAFIKNPTRGMFAYGPGEFEAAFQTIRFEVLADGETNLRMVFVSDQPEQIMNLNVVNMGLSIADTLSFGMASRMLPGVKAISERAGNLDFTLPSMMLLNQVTGGMAEKQLAISPQQMFKGFLAKHSLQHYNTLLGSLRTWRQIPDWLDAATLPDWVIEGQSS